MVETLECRRLLAVDVEPFLTLIDSIQVHSSLTLPSATSSKVSGLTPACRQKPTATTKSASAA